jgi:phage terminase small subunit
MQSPLLPVINSCVERITWLGREFGLTPAARSRILAHTQQEDDDSIERALSMG